MKATKKIWSFLVINKRTLLLFSMPILFFIIIFIIATKDNNHTNIEPYWEQQNSVQKQKIETLTQELNQLKEQLSTKQRKDSILQAQSKKEIAELKAMLKNIKTENEKKRLLLNTADIDEGYDILTNNIKKRSK